MNYGWGNLYCIDTSVGPEPPVVFWNHEAGDDQVPEVCGEGFCDWLHEEMLDDERAPVPTHSPLDPLAA